MTFISESVSAYVGSQEMLKCLVWGMKGRKQRNVILERLLPLLWPGLTDREIALLRDIDSAEIKNLTVESRPVFETVEKHTVQDRTEQTG